MSKAYSIRTINTLLLFFGTYCLLGNHVHQAVAQVRFGIPPHQEENASLTEPGGTASAFYRTIIDNNIFRPLGWTPPPPTPVYRLLGTTIATEGKDRQAILQEIASERLYFLTVGDKVGDATVTEIHATSVKLEKARDIYTLLLGPLRFLSPPTPRATARSRSAAQTGDDPKDKSPTVHIQTVSREDRRRLIQRYSGK